MKHKDQHCRKWECPQCKKEFYCYIDTWVYTRQPNGSNKLFFCSWKCLNAFDAVRIKQRKKRGRKPKEQSDDRQRIQSV